MIDTVDVTNMVLNFVSRPVCVVKMRERICKSDDVQEWKVGFAQFAGVDAAEPHSHKEWKTCQGAARLHAPFATRYLYVVKIFSFVVIRVYQRIGHELEIHHFTAFDKKEDDVLNALPGSSVLPIDENRFSAFDSVIPEQIWKFQVTVK